MGIAGSNRRGRGSGPGGPKAPGHTRSPKPGPQPGPQPGKSTLDVIIDSTPEAAKEVQRKILDDIARHGFSGQSAFAVKLALEEALNNAIRHGNCRDPKKKVHVQAKITPKRAEIIIEDQGPGFDRSCVPDPTLAHNLEKASGRGILLIEAFMTEVKWTHGGRRLRMVKKNEADETNS
jgi:serine/threonine-protein kinase RsbW